MDEKRFLREIVVKKPDGTYINRHTDATINPSYIENAMERTGIRHIKEIDH